MKSTTYFAEVTNQNAEKYLSEYCIKYLSDLLVRLLT